MPTGRKPKGDQPVTITAATKVTAEERDLLRDRYGSVYLGVRAGVDRVLTEIRQGLAR